MGGKRSQRSKKRGWGRKEKETVTESKGEKPVSELCLHSSGDEMKMISVRIKKDMHSDFKFSEIEIKTPLSIWPK